MSLKVLSFIDIHGNVILKERLTELPLKEECVISKSIELFNDSEPCIIHRTYVMKKIIFEIDDYLNNVLKDGKDEILKDEIPENIMQALDINSQVEKVLIYEIK